MAKIVALDGNDAVAEAMKQINPHVVAAYPITPQTDCMEKFAEFVSDGEVGTELMLPESEHSAQSACVGAAISGGRVMTATASQGLALMHEILYVSSSFRLPIVMNVMNRALNSPLNIHCDHSDSMPERDSSWIQLYGENAQEAYDNTIQAVRIAENENVRLPVMCMLEGFITSHTIERLEILNPEDVQDFIGDFNAVENPFLDTENPATYGPVDLQDYNFEHKRQQTEAMDHAPKVIEEVGDEFEKITGRKYGLVDTTETEDADRVIVVLGSTAGTTRSVVRELRRKGEKVGLLKIRSFRPFPKEEIVRTLEGVDKVAVLDRSDSYGGYGAPLFVEVRNALYDVDDRPQVYNYVYGLGGRDVTQDHMKKVFHDLEEGIEERKQYLGLRE